MRVAGVVGSPDNVTVGKFLYPKPCVSKLIEAIGNPKTAVAVAPDPVVSLESGVIVTVGADVYVPPPEIAT